MTRSQREQLAAHVSGDSSPRDMAAVREWIAKTPAAAELVRAMERDARRLRELPRRNLSVDFTKPWAEPIRPCARTARAESYWPIAIAAAVLVALGVGLIFTQSPPATVLPVEPPSLTVADSHQPPQSVVPAPTLPERPSNSPEQPRVVVRPEPAPAPQAKAGPVLTAPPAPPPQPVQVEAPRLALPLAFAELESPAGRARCVAELRRGPDHRVEVFAPDLAALLARLSSVAKSEKLHLTADAALLNRPKFAPPLTALAGYADSLTADDWVSLLTKLGRADRSTSELIAHVVITDLNEIDRRELTQWFGTDPTAEPRPIDPRRPLADQTADSITKTLTLPRRAATDRPFALLNYPAGKGGPVDAAREFLAARPTRSAGNPAVMLVLRRK